MSWKKWVIAAEILAIVAIVAAIFFRDTRLDDAKDAMEEGNWDSAIMILSELKERDGDYQQARDLIRQAQLELFERRIAVADSLLSVREYAKVVEKLTNLPADLKGDTMASEATYRAQDIFAVAKFEIAKSDFEKRNFREVINNLAHVPASTKVSDGIRALLQSASLAVAKSDFENKQYRLVLEDLASATSEEGLSLRNAARSEVEKEQLADIAMLLKQGQIEFAIDSLSNLKGMGSAYYKAKQTIDSVLRLSIRGEWSRVRWDAGSKQTFSISLDRKGGYRENNELINLATGGYGAMMDLDCEGSYSIKYEQRQIIIETYCESSNSHLLLGNSKRYFYRDGTLISCNDPTWVMRR